MVKIWVDCQSDTLLALTDGNYNASPPLQIYLKDAKIKVCRICIDQRKILHIVYSFDLLIQPDKIIYTSNLISYCGSDCILHVEGLDIRKKSNLDIYTSVCIHTFSKCAVRPPKER